MAPLTPPPLRLAPRPELTALVAPPLWLLVAASVLPPPRRARARARAPARYVLAVAALCLAAHPLLRAPPRADAHIPALARQAIPPPPVDDIPTGPVAPTPSASPAPSAPPATQPPATTAPGGGGVPGDGGGEPTDRQLTLDECSGGLQRMQVVLLLELCFEILFLFLRCFAEIDEFDDDDGPPVDITLRGYVFVRAIYTVPVLALNAGIYWVGGGPTGTCLSNFSEVQVVFTHLIFYVIYCFIVVIIGVYRIDRYDDKSTTSTAYYDTSSPTYRSDVPPTRTTSYFRGYTRRRRSTTDTTSYDEPKFRVNLGCCALNF